MNEVLIKLFIGTQFARFWRRLSKENLDEDVHKKIGFITFSKAATKRDSNVAWIHRENWCIFEQFTYSGGATIQPELMNHVLIPYNWREFIYHRGSVYNQVSITKSGPVKESKEGRRTVFFTPLDPFGSDAHAQEEPCGDYSRPRKVHYHSHWRNDQNAAYWVELSRAQDIGFQLWQTKSNAIIVHQSVPYRCIHRVVGDNGGRITFQRILTPRPKLNSNSQRHVHSAAAAKRAAAAAAIFREWQLLRENKKYDMTSSSNCIGKPGSIRKWGSYCLLGLIFASGITQEEFYNDKENMEQVKKQVEKLQDETNSQSTKKRLARRSSVKYRNGASRSRIWVTSNFH